jgi:dUTP pyrophosphatase
LRVSVPIQVKIVRLPNGFGLQMPTRMTAQAAGFDLCAAVDEPVEMLAGQIVMVPCGFAMAIPDGYEAQVRPRSGLASRFGVTLINSPGTIDSDYRGEVFVPLINHGKQQFTIQRGMRIAQMLILPVPAVEILEVETLDETSRGGGGFGHTGH